MRLKCWSERLKDECILWITHGSGRDCQGGRQRQKKIKENVFREYPHLGVRRSKRHESRRQSSDCQRQWTTSIKDVKGRKNLKKDGGKRFPKFGEPAVWKSIETCIKNMDFWVWMDLPETVNSGCLWGENLGNLRGRMENDLHFSIYTLVLFKFLPCTCFT